MSEPARLVPPRNAAFAEGCVVLFGDDWAATAATVLRCHPDRVAAWRAGVEIVPMAVLMDVAHLLSKQWDHNLAARAASRRISDQF